MNIPDFIIYEKENLKGLKILKEKSDKRNLEEEKLRNTNRTRRDSSFFRKIIFYFLHRVSIEIQAFVYFLFVLVIVILLFILLYDSNS